MGIFQQNKIGLLLFPLLIFGLMGWMVGESSAQLSTDRRLCGGYMREVNDHIDFRFNENSAPPDVAQGKKICMWTISPTVPTEQFQYNITIRNINLNCAAGDKIAINFFDESSNETSLGTRQGANNDNPLCYDETVVWRRVHAQGTTMVVILYVEEVVYGKGFYMEWEQGWDSRITPGRIRNTYYSYGRPSPFPSPYFAQGFFRNEISTLGFVKANYTDGYQMELYFDEIQNCEGQDDWQHCFNNTLIVYSIQDNGTLHEEQRWTQHNNTLTPPVASKNGFFIMVKIVDEMYAGGKFVMQYDTVRG